MKKSNNFQLSFRKKDLFILFFILFISLTLRLYKINTPLADLLSWRQADTAAVARNFVRHGFNLLMPTYDDFSNVQSGMENPQGLRFVEFPLYNAIFAAIYKIIPIIPIEIYGRLTSVFFSLIIISVIYYLLLKESGRVTAIIGSLTYAIFPFFVFFSRVVLPETMALALAFLSIFFLYLYTNEVSKFKLFSLYLLSLICFAISLLIKPTVIFYGIALLYIFLKKYHFSLLKRVNFYLFFLISLIPLALWRYYISAYPQGVPANEWLITSVNTYQGLQNIFFRPAFFRWIFFERIGLSIFGAYLLSFFILGTIIKQKSYLFHFFLFSALLYLFVFQGGNVQHEYYQTLILPPLAIFVGLGVNGILNNFKQFANPIISYLTIFIVFLFAFLFSFYRVKDYYNYSLELPQIGTIISTLTNPDDKIVTDRSGDTTLLYLADRKGAPAIYKDPADLKNIGYKYLVTLKQEDFKKYKEELKLKLIFENDKFAMFQL